jgi:hypothetical protein
MSAEIEDGEIVDGSGTPQPAQMTTLDRAELRFQNNTEPRDAQVSF